MNFEIDEALAGSGELKKPPDTGGFLETAVL
jgi:hypothetical protein